MPGEERANKMMGQVIITINYFIINVSSEISNKLDKSFVRVTRCDRGKLRIDFSDSLLNPIRIYPPNLTNTQQDHGFSRMFDIAQAGTD